MSDQMKDMVWVADGKPAIDAAIAWPNVLMADDGRVFPLSSWAPVVDVNGVVTVTATFIVTMDLTKTAKAG